MVLSIKITFLGCSLNELGFIYLYKIKIPGHGNGYQIRGEQAFRIFKINRLNASNDAYNHHLKVC